MDQWVFDADYIDTSVMQVPIPLATLAKMSISEKIFICSCNGMY